MESTQVKQTIPTDIFANEVQLPDEILRKLSMIAGVDVTKEPLPDINPNSDEEDALQMIDTNKQADKEGPSDKSVQKEPEETKSRPPVSTKLPTTSKQQLATKPTIRPRNSVVLKDTNPLEEKKVGKVRSSSKGKMNT